MVNTFLPYADVQASLACLDSKRLFKQAVEAVQILSVLQRISKDPSAKVGYRYHPAVLMWVGYEDMLRFYLTQCLIMIRDTLKREGDGQAYDTKKMQQRLDQEFGGSIVNMSEVSTLPFWWGSEPFHASHRASLYRKDPMFYAMFETDAFTFADYIWPIRSVKKQLKRHELYSTMKNEVACC